MQAALKKIAHSYLFDGWSSENPIKKKISEGNRESLSYCYQENNRYAHKFTVIQICLVKDFTCNWKLWDRIYTKQNTPCYGTQDNILYIIHLRI